MFYSYFFSIDEVFDRFDVGYLDYFGVFSSNGFGDMVKECWWGLV